MPSNENLTSIFTDTAEAIRSKTGKTAKLTPINFADEISTIETGGGGGGQEIIDNKLSGQPVIEEVSSNVTKLAKYGLSYWNNVKKFNLLKLQVIGSYTIMSIHTPFELNIDKDVVTSIENDAMGYITLTNELIFNKVTQATSRMFYKVKTPRIYMPKLILDGTNKENYAFYFCYATEISLPLATNKNANYQAGQYRGDGTFAHSDFTKVYNLPLLEVVSRGCFEECIALEKIDLPSLRIIGDEGFLNCSMFKTLILRKNAVCTLYRMNAFQGTKIGTSEGSIYVPDDLVSAYKSASNWASFASKIKPLSTLPPDA